MECVIDSNFLKSPELEIYFRRNKSNKVILTSDLQNEVSQTVNLENMKELTHILTKYPSQVISLKPTPTIFGLSGRSKGLRKRLIHKHSAEGFKAFSLFMNSDEDDKSKMGQVLMRDAIIKADIIKALKNEANQYLKAFKDTEAIFTEAEMLDIRKNIPLKEETIEKFFKLVTALTTKRFKEIPNRGKWPKSNEWPNLFLFRLSFFQTFYFLNWVAKGSPKNLNLKKIGNDLIDLNFCTYATYFDGLLTKDKTCKKTFEDGRAILMNQILQIT